MKRTKACVDSLPSRIILPPEPFQEGTSIRNTSNHTGIIASSIPSPYVEKIADYAAESKAGKEMLAPPCCAQPATWLRLLAQ
ncbi:hypothetical protein [Candidatus Magnetaquicoccus inordinatus]|uniref:hypothetical protein n=1 Tax=Candidatus Magnetaquicoccus inordinatus TaxID=2496818 RepID=UPI00187D2449|nr:hypothetical protein [Candidatus Magnetaquicoccus inordinatus]